MITEPTIPAAAKKAIDWESLRSDFPILHQKVHGQPLIYFDNAATSQKPRAVIDARNADEIVFTRGTTESINLVAQSWGGRNLKPGDKILLTEMEHHSNLVPWQMLAERTGARLVYLPVTGDEGLLDLSKLDEALTEGVKLFAMVHISNSLGTVNPVAELCERARRLGIVTLVDAAQSAG